MVLSVRTKEESGKQLEEQKTLSGRDRRKVRSLRVSRRYTLGTRRKFLQRTEGKRKTKKCRIKCTEEDTLFRSGMFGQMRSRRIIV